MKEVVLISSIAGVIGTGIGGLLGMFFGSKMIGNTLSYTGGLMIGIVFFDLFPLAVSLINLLTGIICIIIGVLVINVLDIFLDLQLKYKNKANQQLINTGIIILITMGFHNFLEGLAIGSTQNISQRIGLLVAITIATHDIPEGMAVSAPLAGGKLNKKKILLLTIFSGLSTIFGAVFGLWVGNTSKIIAGISICIAIGAMLYISFGELLPNALDNSFKKSNALVTIIGILSSLIIIHFLK